MARHPLETPEQTATARGATLEEAARLYSKRAQDCGRDWGLWQVWLALGGARGLSLAEAVEELDPQGRRWLAVAAFEADQASVGLPAYERYLQAPDAIGPFSDENVVFLAALADAGGGVEALRWVDELEARAAGAPQEQLWAARFLLASGRASMARARLEPLLSQRHAWAGVWAVSALVAAEEGEEERARRDAAEAVKRELLDPELRAALHARLGSEWERLVSEHAPLERLGYEEARQAFRATPPLLPVPSLTQQPHWYGGVDYAMPACKGCGHDIHQWFSFDLGEIPELKNKLPSWTRVPFLGCVDCLMWMGRHDYRLDERARRIELTRVSISASDYGRERRRTPALERRYVELTRRAVDPENSGPVVAGIPFWEQDPQRVFCPECREAMIYVGAMATPEAFEPPFVINNETGFQYHFACNACHCLSVIAQFS